MIAIHVTFSPTHDAAVITWDLHPMDLPLDAVNHALYLLYTEGEHPYIYEAYDGGNAVGLILCPPVEWEADEPDIPADMARAAFLRKVLDDHAASPQTGDWAPTEWRL